MELVLNLSYTGTELELWPIFQIIALIAPLWFLNYLIGFYIGGVDGRDNRVSVFVRNRNLFFRIFMRIQKLCTKKEEWYISKNCPLIQGIYKIV